MFSTFSRIRRGHTVVLGAIALGLSAGTPALAGGPFSPTPGAYRYDRTFDRLCRDLSLSDDQKTAIRPIFVDYEHRSADIRGDSALDSYQKNEQLSNLRFETGEAIKKQLNSDQSAKFDGMWFRENGGTLERMTTQLDLTSDQRMQVRSILENYYSRAEAIRQSATFEGEDQSSDLKDLRRQTADDIRKVLTPDQITRFEAMQDGLWMRRGAVASFHADRSTDKMISHLRQGLKLNDKQTREFTPIIARYEDKMQEIRSSGLTANEKREKFEVANDRAVNDMKRLLYPRQLPKFDDVWDQLKLRY